MLASRNEAGQTQQPRWARGRTTVSRRAGRDSLSNGLGARDPLPRSEGRVWGARPDPPAAGGSRLTSNGLGAERDSLPRSDRDCLRSVKTFFGGVQGGVTQRPSRPCKTVVGRSSLEHDDGEVEEAIADAAQGAGVSQAAATHGLVEPCEVRIDERGVPRPVVDRVAQAGVARAAHVDDAAAAALLGDGCAATRGAQEGGSLLSGDLRRPPRASWRPRISRPPARIGG